MNARWLQAFKPSVAFAWLTVVGCVEPPSKAPVVLAPNAVAAPSAGASLAPHASRPQSGTLSNVRVVVRGTLRARPGGHAICPLNLYQQAEVDCAAATGLTVKGLAPEPAARLQGAAVAVTGTYDGEALVAAQVAALPPRAAGGSGVHVEPYRNPCPQFQSSKAGQVNGSASLNAEAERLRTQYGNRFADAIWDERRQAMTLRFVGEVSDIQSEARVGPEDRLCIVGGARMSEPSWSAVGERIQAAIQALPDSERPLLLSMGRRPLSDVFEVKFETLDRRSRQMVKDVAGVEVAIEAFLELVEAPLSALPSAKYWGDLPLQTSPSRTPGAAMNALGHFALRIDRAQQCVYLKDAAGERVMPSLPFGYMIKDTPLRLVNPSGATVATEDQVLPWGGGLIDVNAKLRLACGATKAWAGEPMATSPNAAPPPSAR